MQRAPQLFRRKRRPFLFRSYCLSSCCCEPSLPRHINPSRLRLQTAPCALTDNRPMRKKGETGGTQDDNATGVCGEQPIGVQEQERGGRGSGRPMENSGEPLDNGSPAARETRRESRDKRADEGVDRPVRLVPPPRIPTDSPFIIFSCCLFFCCRLPVDRGQDAEQSGEACCPPIPLPRCSARDARRVAWQPPRAT